jgi:hypothetical protein
MKKLTIAEHQYEEPRKKYKPMSSPKKIAGKNCHGRKHRNVDDTDGRMRIPHHFGLLQKQRYLV